MPDGGAVVCFLWLGVWFEWCDGEDSVMCFDFPVEAGDIADCCFQEGHLVKQNVG